jgi:nicotinamidase-related amidase
MRVLVVVDMQNDFIDGALGTPEAQAIVPKVVKKIEEFDGVILHTLDTHYGDYLDTQEGKLLPVKHCLIETEGWEMHPLIEEAIRHKSRESGYVQSFLKGTFGSVDLALYLQNDWLPQTEGDINEIVLVGLCTDICVISNALLLKAFLPEVKITVDASCCAGVTPESHKNALEAMKMCQINIENEEVTA